MSEVLSFYEGSAYLYTGNASALALFVRNVQVNATVRRHEYRPPHSTTWTYIDMQDTPAQVTIGQAWHSGVWPKLAYAGTGGSLVLHLKHVPDGSINSGGIWLYTGTLQALRFNGADGNAEQTISLQGEFKAWSAY